MKMSQWLLNSNPGPLGHVPTVPHIPNRNPSSEDFFTPLLATHFPTGGLLATHIGADCLLDWRLGVKWA